MKLFELLKSEITKITLLEILYLSIFFNTSQVKRPPSRASSPPDSQQATSPLVGRDADLLKTLDYTFSLSSSRSSSGSQFQYLGNADVVGGLLQYVETKLKELQSFSGSDRPRVSARISSLSLLVHEARTRFILAQSSPRSSKTTSFMARMTASPTTLLTYCMRAGLRNISV